HRHLHSFPTRRSSDLISPEACSLNTSTSSGKRICPSEGSSEAGRYPVGPIEPATKRDSPAAPRAISAALVLISSVSSARPHSPRDRKSTRLNSSHDQT